MRTKGSHERCAPHENSDGVRRCGSDGAQCDENRVFYVDVFRSMASQTTLSTASCDRMQPRHLSVASPNPVRPARPASTAALRLPPLFLPAVGDPNASHSGLVPGKRRGQTRWAAGVMLRPLCQDAIHLASNAVESMARVVATW